LASALTDLGIGAGLHQHTGTAVETRDEVYYVWRSNTGYEVAPDAGQLQRAALTQPR
jgi:inosose dehydratase